MRILGSLVLVAQAVAVPSATVAAVAGNVVARCPRHPKVRLHAWFDLPKADDRSHGLSGLTWSSGKLYVVGDRRPAIGTLVPDADFTHFAFGDTLPVDLGSGHKWDVEAVAQVGDRFLLGNEAGPTVQVVGGDGKVEKEMPLPPSFAGSRFNHGLESLAVSPDGRVLFVANENAFEGDGGLGDGRRGTLVRLTRIDLEEKRPTVQNLYLTDPIFSAAPDGRTGVSEMAALSSSQVLVMERAYVPAKGNSVRVYCVDLPPWDAPAPRPVKKVPFLDLVKLSDSGVPAPSQPQRNRLLDNFEGLTVGPRLPDGRRLLFLVSDDNGAAVQVARVIVLAVDL